ncbi:hypothetical protein COU74_04410 [Candidatus Peregrinibacteria bacterium CG10_big_fil_rev_8_21_14_0_10_36_19]|nr:MAG: hypothetical protein COU74_04410 [Candidatus Peregrinibacteria bacterium CG10_big_fil_rev_8_21_14_0_10_36_19]
MPEGLEENLCVRGGSAGKFFHEVLVPCRERVVLIANEMGAKLREAAYSLIETVNGEVLVLKRGPSGGQVGKWEFPGGKKEDDHADIVFTSLVETVEETGVYLCSAHVDPERNREELVAEMAQVIALGKEVPFPIGFRYSFERSKSGEPVLFLVTIIRWLIDSRVPVSLSDEHDDFEWVDRGSLSAVDFARPFYREAALAVVDSCNKKEQAVSFELAPI